MEKHFHGKTVEAAQNAAQKAGYRNILKVTREVQERTDEALAPTSEAAIQEVRKGVPSEAFDIGPALVEEAQSGIIEIRAQTKTDAIAQWVSKCPPGATLVSFDCKNEPKNGILGIGKKPGEWAVTWHKQFRAVVSYKLPCTIIASNQMPQPKTASRASIKARTRDEIAKHKQALPMPAASVGATPTTVNVGFAGYATQAAKDAWAQAMVGVQFMTERKFHEALAISDQAIAKHRECKEAWVVKGGALSVLNRPEEALACFNKALLIDPKYDVALDQRTTLLQHCPTLDIEAVPPPTLDQLCVRCRKDFTGQRRWGLECSKCPAEICHGCSHFVDSCPKCGGRLLNSML